MNLQKTFKILSFVYVFASLIGTVIFLLVNVLNDLLSNEVSLFIFYIPFSLSFVAMLLLAFGNPGSGFFIHLILWSIVLFSYVLILWSLFIYLKKNKFLMIFIVYITDIAALLWFNKFDVFSYSVALRLGVKLIFLGVLIVHFVMHIIKNIKANLP